MSGKTSYGTAGVSHLRPCASTLACSTLAAWGDSATEAETGCATGGCATGAVGCASPQPASVVNPAANANPRNILPDGWRESNGTAAAICRNWGTVNHAQCCVRNYGRPQAFVQAAPGQPTQAAKAVSAWVYGKGEAPAEPTWANPAANAALRFGRSLTLPLCTTVRQEPHPPTLHCGSAGASPSHSDSIHS